MATKNLQLRMVISNARRGLSNGVHTSEYTGWLEICLDGAHNTTLLSEYICEAGVNRKVIAFI